MNKYDLLIIGAGPGGYEAAFDAADAGMSVALIEKDKLGGTCLNRGCIPTKALMHSSDVYAATKNGASVGVEVEGLTANREAIGAHKDHVLETLRTGIAAQAKKKKITVIEGSATIVNDNLVSVVHSDGEQEELSAERILIATGSHPWAPPIPGSDLPGVINSTDLINMGGADIPEFIIVGGGVIGIEFATIYADLGSKVTVIEGLDRLLPMIDKEIGRSIKMTLSKKGVDCHTSAKVEKIEQDGDKLVVTFNEKDQPQTVSGDKVLLCVGRRPTVEGIFASEFASKYDGLTDGRFIVVNDKYQTVCPSVYAIGDCIGRIQLAHTAVAEGRNAVSLMNGGKIVSDLSTVPSCIYTNPEIAVVGITVDEAKEQGLDIITKKFPMSANGKTIIADLDRGFIKLVARADDHVLVGAHLLCGRATDLIGELALAIRNNLTLEDVAETIHPHPTFCEAIFDTARS